MALTFWQEWHWHFWHFVQNRWALKQIYQTGGQWRCASGWQWGQCQCQCRYHPAHCQLPSRMQPGKKGVLAVKARECFYMKCVKSNCRVKMFWPLPPLPWMISFDFFWIYDPKYLTNPTTPLLSPLCLRWKCATRKTRWISWNKLFSHSCRGQGDGQNIEQTKSCILQCPPVKFNIDTHNDLIFEAVEIQFSKAQLLFGISSLHFGGV